MTIATFNRGGRAATGAGASTRSGTTARPAVHTRTVAATTTSATGRWSARGLIGGGLAMIPWLFHLAASLPSTATAAHWDAVWVGLDAAEALGLLATGLLIRRGDPRCSLAATFTATLLTVDAWFDCGTSARGADRTSAVLMAACVEIPLACLLLAVAWRAFPKPVRRRDSESSAS
ncbi:MAG: hypothetical protein ACRDVE_03065 [Actinocrinis sp.]